MSLSPGGWWCFPGQQVGHAIRVLIGRLVGRWFKAWSLSESTQVYKVYKLGTNDIKESSLHATESGLSSGSFESQGFRKLYLSLSQYNLANPTTYNERVEIAMFFRSNCTTFRPPLETSGGLKCH